MRVHSFGLCAHGQFLRLPPRRQRVCKKRVVLAGNPAEGLTASFWVVHMPRKPGCGGSRHFCCPESPPVFMNESEVRANPPGIRRQRAHSSRKRHKGKPNFFVKTPSFEPCRQLACAATRDVLQPVWPAGARLLFYKFSRLKSCAPCSSPAPCEDCCPKRQPCFTGLCGRGRHKFSNIKNPVSFKSRIFSPGVGQRAALLGGAAGGALFAPDGLTKQSRKSSGSPDPARNPPPGQA